jgi:hypothetical protein
VSQAEAEKEELKKENESFTTHEKRNGEKDEEPIYIDARLTELAVIDMVDMDAIVSKNTK